MSDRVSTKSGPDKTLYASVDKAEGVIRLALREYEGPVVIDGVGGIRISWVAGTREIVGLEIPANALEVTSVE